MHFFHTPKRQNSHKEITMIFESYFRQGVFRSNPLFQEKSDKLTISLFYYAVDPNLTQSSMEILTKQCIFFIHLKDKIHTKRLQWYSSLTLEKAFFEVTLYFKKNRTNSQFLCSITLLSPI
uniref:Ribosomal protein S3 n=1 Tax=Meira sp. (in: basidiomycete fungi) TaxID=1707708 RepID=A0A7G5VV00_9BASI|nr:ribosomal protein S3 [Meira sp. (in: basidiomycete fungi)]